MSLLQNGSTRLPVNVIGNNFQINTDSEVFQFSLGAAGLFILSLTIGGLARNRYGLRDTIAITAFLGLLARRAIFAFIRSRIPGRSYIYALVVISFQVLIAVRAPYRSRKTQWLPQAHDTEYPLPPLIFPCRTTHTRFFPTKHSFGYSYLLVGIPIGMNQPCGSLLSTEQCERRTWYSVHSSDYLARGSDAGGLRSKLNAYLATQDISSSQYPFAYLVTAPRFLGFSFNPVSFWYLYDAEKNLAAMILEVNNTFDERRMYFMQNKSRDKTKGADFTNDWTKDFHVSPFNDRDGSYSLNARNPALEIENAQVDNNIVLRSDDGKAKIVARVFSTEPAINPATLNPVQSWLFIARWWWVGFMTNPRILREARTLWVKKLQVFYRPEVFVTSIGRTESDEEVRLEQIFRNYIQSLMSRSTTTACLKYVPAAGTDRGRTVNFLASEDIVARAPLELRVLTPAFYAEAAKAESVLHAFETFCFNSAPGSKMAEVSDPSSMRKILQQASHQDTAGVALPASFRGRGTLENLILLLSFRKGKRGSHPKMSDLDSFVFTNHKDKYRDYSMIVTKLLLADKIALGFTPLLNIYATIVWCAFGYLVAASALHLLEQEWRLFTFARLVLTTSIFHLFRGVWVGPVPVSVPWPSR